MSRWFLSCIVSAVTELWLWHHNQYWRFWSSVCAAAHNWNSNLILYVHIWLLRFDSSLTSLNRCVCVCFRTDIIINWEFDEVFVLFLFLFFLSFYRSSICHFCTINIILSFTFDILLCSTCKISTNLFKSVSHMLQNGLQTICF